MNTYDIFDLHFPSPPILGQKFEGIIDLNLLRDIRSEMCEVIDYLTGKNKFTQEIEILSKFYYKFLNQWRREKCLKFIKQAINSLDKFQRANFVQTLTKFIDLIPSRFSILSKEELQLPTASVFLFLAGKLLTASVIIYKAIKNCILASIEILKQIELKLFLAYMTFSHASVSSLKFHLEILKEKIFAVYELLFRGFQFVYPTIQFPFTTNIKDWYSKLYLDRNLERKEEICLEMRNVEEPKINDLRRTTGPHETNVPDTALNHNNKILKKINCESRAKHLHPNKMKLVNKVKLFLATNNEENSGFNIDEAFMDGSDYKNLLFAEEDKFNNVLTIENTNTSEVGNKLKLEDIYLNNHQASNKGNKEEVIENKKLNKRINQSNPLSLKKDEINRFMRKCIKRSNSSTDVEKMFLNFLQRHDQMQFNGLLVALRNFKILNKRKDKNTRAQVFTKLALKIVMGFFNEN